MNWNYEYPPPATLRCAKIVWTKGKFEFFLVIDTWMLELRASSGGFRLNNKSYKQRTAKLLLLTSNKYDRAIAQQNFDRLADILRDSEHNEAISVSSIITDDIYDLEEPARWMDNIGKN